jgi:folate-binding protein YgfZ
MQPGGRGGRNWPGSLGSMKTIDASLQELEALEQGRAFADLSSYRKVRVGGADARSWLHSLVTTDVDSLEPGRARRSLLLSPTGRIRADFSIACEDDGFLLLQAPDQPSHVGLLLSSYTLSSDVSLHDATNELALFAVPGRAARAVGRPGMSPSVLGSGIDLISPVGKPAWRVEDMFVKKNLIEARPPAVETWRIRRGIPRMGADFGPESLPAEAGLEEMIDRTKGCFLGQEAVAKVINLGHPPHVLKHVRANAELARGMPVSSDHHQVGEITSAAPAAGGGWVAIARVEWASQQAESPGAPLLAGVDTPLLPQNMD